MTREAMPDIQYITTAKLTIGLDNNQVFYKTPKAWEIWQTTPRMMLVKRIDGRRVYWIIPYDTEGPK